MPPSGRAPRKGLTASALRACAQQLLSYHASFKDLFSRREQRDWSLLYLRGQLSDLERKSIEPLVFALRGRDPAAVRAMQTFLGEGAWDDQALRQRHQQLVAQRLGEPGGLLIVDGSGFPKQGQHSVGVARQYCGHLGKIANCQHGVFAAYSSSRGTTFVDARLYMPQRWFDAEHAERRRRCAVPEELEFRTEPQLALDMVSQLAQRGALPFSWVLGDETYGADSKFVDGVQALGKLYFVEVPKTTRVFLGPVPLEPIVPGSRGRPRTLPRRANESAPPVQVQHVADQLPESAWTQQALRQGTKGPLWAQIACVPVTRSVDRGRPGAKAWLVLRRSLSPHTPLKMFLSNAPPEQHAPTLGRLSSLRWPIETLLEEAKSELGMDHYEVRSWRGWHHQMTQTFLAHPFLVGLRQGQEKKARR